MAHHGNEYPCSYIGQLVLPNWSSSYQGLICMFHDGFVSCTRTSPRYSEIGRYHTLQSKYWTKSQFHVERVSIPPGYNPLAEQSPLTSYSSNASLTFHFRTNVNVAVCATPRLELPRYLGNVTGLEAVSIAQRGDRIVASGPHDKIGYCSSRRDRHFILTYLTYLLTY